MAPFVCSSSVLASPSTIWSRCLAPMTFEEWDDDVTSLEGIEKGLVQGGSYTFLMKTTSLRRIPIVVTSVIENERMAYTGTALLGLIRFKGLIEISSTSKAPDVSQIKYTFDMYGALGAIIYYFQPHPAVHGTKTGLANLVRLSEEAQIALRE